MTNHCHMTNHFIYKKRKLNRNQRQLEKKNKKNK